MIQCRVCKQLKEETEYYHYGDKHKLTGKVCKVCFRARQRAWAAKNGKEGAKYSKELRLRAMGKLSDGDIKCNKCGFNDIRALQIDHIHGGGSKHITSFTSRHIYMVGILNDSDAKSKFQILCANCNWIKRVENKEAKGCVPIKVDYDLVVEEVEKPCQWCGEKFTTRLQDKLYCGTGCQKKANTDRKALRREILNALSL